MKKLRNSKKQTKKWLYIAISSTVVILLAYSALAYSINLWPFHEQDTTTLEKKSTIQDTDDNHSQTGSNTESDKPSTSENPSKDPEVSNEAASNDLVPTAPKGSFVNNHNPSLTQRQGLNQMYSVCETSADVYCTIEFSKNDIVKSLSTQKTNTAGATSWSWTLQQVGLTSGTWTVTARAINGEKISITSDPIKLEVSE